MQSLQRDPALPYVPRGTLEVDSPAPLYRWAPAPPRTERARWVSGHMAWVWLLSSGPGGAHGFGPGRLGWAASQCSKVWGHQALRTLCNMARCAQRRRSRGAVPPFRILTPLLLHPPPCPAPRPHRRPVCAPLQHPSRAAPHPLPAPDPGTQLPAGVQSAPGCAHGSGRCAQHGMNQCLREPHTSVLPQLWQPESGIQGVPPGLMSGGSVPCLSQLPVTHWHALVALGLWGPHSHLCLHHGAPCPSVSRCPLLTRAQAGQPARPPQRDLTSTESCTRPCFHGRARESGGTSSPGKHC